MGFFKKLFSKSIGGASTVYKIYFYFLDVYEFLYFRVVGLNDAL